MFTFLLEPETPLLSSTSFYRSIHHQLGPLQKPLLSSTSPDRIHERLLQTDAYQSSVGTKPPSQHEHIYDVVFDSANRTLHTSLPNIPEPGILHQKVRAANDYPRQQLPWSRPDALNVHAQLVNTFIETRDHASDIERTCKTNRGWWVLWMRIRDRQRTDNKTTVAGQQSPPDSISPQPFPSPSPSPSPSQPVKEVFLVRKASDYSAPGHNRLRNASGSGFFSSLAGLSTTSSKTGTGGREPRAGIQIGEGVGIDARRYIDALLSLGR